MKKTFTLIGCGLAVLLSTQIGLAQSSAVGQAEVTTTPGRLGNPPAAVMSLFDVQFNLDVTAATGGAGNAGVLYFNNEFWVSEWNSANVWKLDNAGNLTGNFTIPTGTGGGIRAMTTDGSYVYASQNGTGILKIDPATESVVATISVASLGFTARSLTYDPTADGGNGGFWVSNYGTDIVQVSMTGAMLTSIPASSHTLTGMYGTAYDNISTPGAQFLWVFNQAGTTAAPLAEIWQVDINTGYLTGATYEVNAGLGTGTLGLAGGVCIATGIAAQPSICGLLQENPDLIVGLELPITTGISENSGNDNISLFPIPATDAINFVINNSNAQQIEVRMFNLQGQVVKSLQTAPGKISIDVKDLASGLYTVEILNGDSKITKKFMVD
ncbi:MAG TPA: T9SS type A sorting domain-containing protein [Bacteroidia bacterium]|nr:T9SS type A sorting domain-containing protein [Bacteroidia bacterium]